MLEKLKTHLLTTAKVADLLGISPATIRNHLKGRNTILGNYEPSFPDPIIQDPIYMWRGEEVEEWLKLLFSGRVVKNKSMMPKPGPKPKEQDGPKQEELEKDETTEKKTKKKKRGRPKGSKNKKKIWVKIRNVVKREVVP